MSASSKALNFSIYQVEFTADDPDDPVPGQEPLISQLLLIKFVNEKEAGYLDYYILDDFA